MSRHNGNPPRERREGTSNRAGEHIYWDQATVLVQLGLLDPTDLPVSGRDAAAKVLDPTIPGPQF